MPLDLVIGAPGCDLEAPALERARRDAASGSAVLVPAQTDVVRVQRLLARDHPVGAAVAQLDRMVETQWALHGDGRAVVSRATRAVLVARAWAAASTEPCGPGMRRIIEELVRSATGTPRTPVGAPASTERMLEAVREYRRLAARHGLVEPREAMALLAGAATAPAASVIAHGFSDLDPAQTALLVAWARCGDVLVTLPYDPGHPATEACAPVYDALLAAGATVTRARVDEARALELQQVVASLYLPPEPIRAAGHVRLVTVSGEEAEARRIAAEVAEVVSAGVPPSDVAVAFRDPSRHADWLRRALDDAGIEADHDLSVPVGETPLGAALSTLRSAVEGRRRADVVAFLRTPFSGAAAARVDSLDARWRRDRCEDGDQVIRDLGVLAAPRAIMRLARAVFGSSVDAAHAAKWKELVDQLLTHAHPGDAVTHDREALLDAAVHRALLRAVDALLALGGGTADELMDSLLRARVSVTVLERPGAIRVMGVDRIRGRSFHTVVLGGMTASEFPRRGGGDALEGDAVRAALTACGIDADAGREAALERLLFAQVVGRAHQRLVVVRQESDDEGRVLRRSILWDELLDRYARDGDEAPPVIAAQPDAEVVSPAAASRRPVRGRILDAQILAALAGLESVSASAIETYLACPYQWYVHRVLRPEGLDAEIDQLAKGALAHAALAAFYRAVIGTGVHERVTPLNLVRLMPDAERAVDEALVSAPPVHTREEGLAIASVRRQVLGLVERDATFMPGYRPRAVEWDFGVDEGPTIAGAVLRGRADRVDVGPEGLLVIDYKLSHVTPAAKLAEEGKVQLQLYALAAAAAYGLPVAGGLYRSLSKGKDRGFVIDEADAPGITRTDRVDAQGLRAILDEALARSEAAVEGMRGARIEPTPGDACRFCAAAAWCEEARS